MSPSTPAVDRRADIKNRHRRAILDAAAAIMRERESSVFSVDELAARANVSRRTVFNHFASIDDVVIAVFGIELGAVVERLATIPEGPGSSMFDDLAETVRSTDLVPPMVYLTRVLGGDEPEPTPKQALLAARTFTEISTGLAAEMQRRHPGATALRVNLLVGSLTSGLLVIYQQWFTECGAFDTVQTRSHWTELVETLLESLRTGFGAR
ncbi:TetR family transcriptional regulator [Paeniglutamicibacter terrestris]|uniref:TetR/AcrR family transcriptional regulator n=1 Tax=Paeniglutamicibacter terrestris TaxID=2723403 RepID=A0ABX1G6M1_9MICC|nr:TetR/AcrR family transcriptional regulator [Paeniglutamicibacter terrestris]